MSEEVRRVLVLAPNWLGDAVMALPAIDDVRTRYPHAHLAVAARPAIAPLFSMVSGVDEVIELEWRGGIRQIGAMRRDSARLHALGARVAILLPNSFASAWLARAGRIPERWGYARDLRRALLTRAIQPPQGSRHQGAYYQHLVRELGMANGPLEPRVAVPESAVSDARALLARHGTAAATPLVVFAPGAAYGHAKRWLPAHFAALAAALIQESGVACVLVGSEADRETTGEILSLLPADVRARAIDLAGATSLRTLAGVLALSRAAVSNDSGAMHLAAAVGVPLAAIFGPTNEHETSPLARAGVQTEILINPVSCRPCMLRECPIDHPCMRELEPAMLVAVVRRLLTGPRAQASGPSTRPQP